MAGAVALFEGFPQNPILRTGRRAEAVPR